MTVDRVEEVLQLVDALGRPCGSAPRHVCHTGHGPAHMIVMLAALTVDGRVLLQKRSMLKEAAPGMWDMGVGGHVGAGEDPVEALEREAMEEVGLLVGPGTGRELRLVGSLMLKIPETCGKAETELVMVYTCDLDDEAVGSLRADGVEVDEVGLYSGDQLRTLLAGGTGSYLLVQLSTSFLYRLISERA